MTCSRKVWKKVVKMWKKASRDFENFQRLQTANRSEVDSVKADMEHQ